MKKTLSFTLIAVALFILVAAFAVSFSFSQTAHATELSPEQIEALAREYTNRTSFTTHDGKSLTLNGYVSDFEHRASFRTGLTSDFGAGNLFQNNTTFSGITNINGNEAIVNVAGDDNITRFVPKVLFTFVNETFYLGEYGFYINTRMVELEEIVGSGTVQFSFLISTVILIEVTNVIGVNYLVTAKIKPLVQLDFHYIAANNTQLAAKNHDIGVFWNRANCTYKLIGVQNAVAPAITVEGIPQLHG